jgi:ABC-2 type transport system permease protein
MANVNLRNVWVVTKREYVERVRSKAFLIMTILTPALMAMNVFLPTLFIGAKTGGTRSVVVVSSRPELADAIKTRLTRPKDKPSQDDRSPDLRYTVTTSTDMTEANRQSLQKQIDQKQIDGFLWMDDASLNDHKLSYTARATNDFIEVATLRSAVRDVLVTDNLRARGVSADEVRAAMKPYDMETIQWAKGKGKSSAGDLQFMSVFFLGFAMYMVVLIFGIGVMRAVLEEKNSRVMEVLLSSVNAMELMAGKILGVGAVGLTQIFIWISLPALGAGLGIATQLGAAVKKANYTLETGIYFAIFFLLGYLLYSTMCAALGAMVTSEQEAQQLQIFVMMPLILSLFLMFFAMRAPNDPRVVAVSMFPFAAPLVMYTRIVVQTPPFWQIASCIGIMIATIIAMVWVCGRIYRVGILMYGKKPTLPEIIKWVRYA